MYRYLVIPALGALWLSGCVSTPGKFDRVWLDSSSHDDSPPRWAQENQVIWEEGDKLRLRSNYTIRGDERVNGCYDLARLDAKETILSEIATSIRGSLDNAQQSINENAEVVLGKVRTGEYKGRVTGLRHLEQYFERYRIGDTERVECYVLSEMSKANYDQLKHEVLSEVEKVDAKLREAITQKQIDFFKPQTASSAAEAQRAPASQENHEEKP